MVKVCLSKFACYAATSDSGRCYVCTCVCGGGGAGGKEVGGCISLTLNFPNIVPRD